MSFFILKKETQMWDGCTIRKLHTVFQNGSTNIHFHTLYKFTFLHTVSNTGYLLLLVYRCEWYKWYFIVLPDDK